MNQYPDGPQQPNPGQPQFSPPPGPYTQYPPMQPGSYTQYPPMQPGYPPPGYPPMQPPQPQQAPKKKSKLGIGCGVIAAVVILIAIISIASNSGKSSSTTTSSSGGNSATQQVPAKPQTWQTTHTYSGSGTKKTETITVPDDWKLQWTCDPTSFNGMNYNVIIAVYNSDGTVADPAAINDMCKQGNTSGETEEHQAGNIYLDVDSEGSWSITIQELK